jgi:hypothetical protein
MPRVLQGVVGIALFIGLGFVTRHYFREWLDTSIQEATKNTAKELGDLKPIQTNFSNVKFDQPVILTPKIEFTQPPAGHGRR